MEKHYKRLNIETKNYNIIRETGSQFYSTKTENIQIITIVTILLIIVTQVKKEEIIIEAGIELLNHQKVVVADIIEQILLDKNHLMINIAIKII